MIRILSPHGRDGRLRYLATVASTDAVGLVDSAWSGADPTGGVLAAAMDLLLLYVVYCAMCRRLADAGRGPVGAAATLGLAIAAGLLARTGATIPAAVASACVCAAALGILAMRPRPAEKRAGAAAAVDVSSPAPGGGARLGDPDDA